MSATKLRPRGGAQSLHKHRQRACGVLSDVHGDSYCPKPAVHTEELVLMAVMLE